MKSATPLHPSYHFPPRSSQTLEGLRATRNAWVATLQPNSLFHRLFDHIPGVHFFAKDAKGRTMFASRGILQRYGMNDDSEMLGRTDFDLNPSIMAFKYVRDDRSLLEGKTDLVQNLELWFDQQGLPDWYVVTKMPILDNQGVPQGVMGVLRHADDHAQRLPVFQAVAKAAHVFRHEFAKPILVAEVAQRCGQSPRQLQRHFHTAFGVTPQEFLTKTRVLAAARLLEDTALTVSEIANRVGYSDTSSFIQHFKQRVGTTPALYRKQRTPRSPTS